jgi:hypothetical protein
MPTKAKKALKKPTNGNGILTNISGYRHGDGFPYCELSNGEVFVSDRGIGFSTRRLAERHAALEMNSRTLIQRPLLRAPLPECEQSHLLQRFATLKILAYR